MRRRGWTVAVALGLVACGGSAPDEDGGRRLDSGARPDGGSACASDADCSDGLFCTGPERCDPGAAGADARGCVAGVSPCGAGELCDETVDACTTECPDSDGDGSASIACGGEDCDDEDANRFPGNVEVCDAAGHDEDCDLATFGADADADGFVRLDCCQEQLDGANACGGDCNDASRDISPTAPESCNGVDDDCDGTIDEGVLTTYYADGDGDGFGDPAGATVAACSAPVGFVPNATDCDDGRAATNPGAPEVCNVVDDDCDGTIDEGVLTLYYADCDADGWGGGTGVAGCLPPAAPPAGCPSRPWNTLGGDCDDGDAGIYPSAAEICDGSDQDCDALVDEAPAESWCNEPARAVHATSATCAGGGCVFTCTAPYLDCTADPSCETDGGVSSAHCGACGSPCPWACASSACDDAVEVAAGADHTCARRASGVLECWGRNNYGQLGDGTTTSRLGPTAVSSLTDAVEVAAGSYHTCTRRASGALACWGRNNYGQLGDGTTTDRWSPTAVSGLTDAVDIRAGWNHTCARRASGGVVCWGDNGTGQLGDGTTTSRETPTAVLDLADAVEIAAGMNDTCARRASGALACWGDNVWGQLGDGTTTERRTPTPVSGLAGAVEVAAGHGHTCARQVSGVLACWGNNYYGQLGDGTTTNRHTPTPVVPP